MSTRWLAGVVLVALPACSPGHEAEAFYIRIDKETGCHYLADTRGGITPRLDRSGKQICAEAPTT